jgi:hypothetical protein
MQVSSSAIQIGARHRRVYLLRALAVAIALVHVSCGWTLAKRVDYSVRPMAVAPIGSHITDGSVAFAEAFCAVLPHTDGAWGDCGQYLETRVAPQPPVASRIATSVKVLIVGGAFSECFEKPGIHIFGPSITHLEQHGVVFGPPVNIGGTKTPEKNAQRIADYLEANPGNYLAIGHSKGAVDLMTAIQHHEIARNRIKALVSVAGAIGGTRLSDLGPTLGVIGFGNALWRAGIGGCRIEDQGGIGSLKRSVRYEAMREWNPPATLRTYSLVAVSPLKKTSKPLHTMWKTNAIHSIDQDSHIIAEEAVIPGSEYLGIARGDHWAVALPMSEHPKTQKKVNENKYPRDALLEAIVRYVTARL